MNTIRFIDLFAGLGGLRVGLEQAAKLQGLESRCVFTSEIKKHAIDTYSHNFPGEEIHGDITQISEAEIPDFDILLAGFPCQPFSSAGKGLGFTDTRGTLFFDIERILAAKKPDMFILENVEGLVTHDRENLQNSTGRTLETILMKLSELGYKVSWRVFDASQYGLPQKRKRIYIVGSRGKQIDLTIPVAEPVYLGSILDDTFSNELLVSSQIVDKLLAKFSMNELVGKQVKDKRGGPNNIHSWEIGLKGEVSAIQQALLEQLLKARRRKSIAISKGISWSDGMPLTSAEFHEVLSSQKLDFNVPSIQNLEKELNVLVKMGYLAFETPKKYPDHPKGYNIVVGKLSFDISNILDPNAQVPTLVATDVTRMVVPVERTGFRRLSIREGLRLFGFPEDYVIPSGVKYSEAFDLLGNSVTLNVVNLVSKNVLESFARK